MRRIAPRPARATLVPRGARLAAGAALLAASTAATGAGAATKAADDYRYFRALSIDLQGRIPTRAEVAAFEADGFDVDGWIDAHLGTAAYAERIRRVYMDLMRLEESSTFQVSVAPTYLRRLQVLDSSGKPIDVYYRLGQRRARDATDGVFCLSNAETGLTFNGAQAPAGTPIPIAQAVLDANTVLVKPWWLYQDYAASSPSTLYGAQWKTPPANFHPNPSLLTSPDGTPTTQIRVCKEEAQTAAKGTVYVTHRTAPPAGTAPPYGRLTQLPLDSTWATKNAGASIDCVGAIALQSSADCGCGPGLERCTPGENQGVDPGAFTLPVDVNLGTSLPLDMTSQTEGSWNRFWWSQEARQFLDDLVLNDRDFREILTSRATMVNGPLAQFYRVTAPATLPSSATTFDYVAPQGLFDAAKVPTDLKPFETDRWERVADRGPAAAGLLTMPIFLTKFGSRRGRAHVVYNAFLCRDFVAGNVQLTPSTEPNLMIRPGCSTCHTTLEPLAAYFSRVVESDWSYLPTTHFPLSQPTCEATDPTKMSRSCQAFYDPAFTSATQSLLRGSYASAAHADAGPAGLASDVTASPDFAPCVAQNVASSFLGRALNADDAAMQAALVDALTTSSFRVKALVRALVKSDAYRNSNNLSSASWRAAQAAKGAP
jgi:hypothetical protein